jgi:hypothetical protein
MKIVALQNFKANGVKAKPGDVLSQEQINQIEVILDKMEKLNLIQIEKDSPPPEPEALHEGLIDEGPGKDELAGEPLSESRPEEQPKPHAKKKKKS